MAFLRINADSVLLKSVFLIILSTFAEVNRLLSIRLLIVLLIPGIVFILTDNTKKSTKKCKFPEAVPRYGTG